MNETNCCAGAACEEDPVRLKGQPIGMYHCPLCGEMCLAGVPHPHRYDCPIVEAMINEMEWDKEE